MVEAERRGRLTIYLGYAAGSGKTYRMVEDGHALRETGLDTVVGYLEPHGRRETLARADGLEQVPRRRIEYQGAQLEEMDTPAILRRRPQICLVDELAHANVPGSERPNRWQDALALLDAGIDVLTTMDIQHLESLNDHVFEITGVRVRETVPDWIVREAEEVVMVDVTPRALRNRVARGVVYDPEKADPALENFFKEPNLVALRELALRQAAHEVDVRQSTRDRAPMTRSELARAARPDRVLIYVTADPASAALIRRGRRVADFIGAECYAICITRNGMLTGLPAQERDNLEKHLSFARNLHIGIECIPGEDPAKTLVDFARRLRITQIFLSRPPQQESRWRRRGEGVMQRVVRLAADIQVTVVGDRRRRPA